VLNVDKLSGILGGAVVLSGGKSGGLPNVNAGRWDDECWLNLNYTDMLNPDLKAGDKLILEKGSERWESWPLNSEVLESAITFASKPAKTQIRLRMAHSSGLSLYPQPLILPEGHSAPENVLGSLAVYHNKAHHRIGGHNYGVGKHSQIYRWECIDAKGLKAWCDPWVVDGEDIVTGLPVDFMKKATYPVIAMGAKSGVGSTFGYTTGGASRIALTESVQAHGSLFDTLVAASGNTVTTLHLYTNWAFFTGTCGVALYSGATQGATMNSASLAFGPATITPTVEYPALAWDTASVNYALSASTEYALAVGDTSTISYGELSLMYDVGGAYDGSRQTSQTLGATWSENDLTIQKYSMYATVTAGGGGGNVLPLPLLNVFRRLQHNTLVRM
jgi:hypothetical protein